MKFNQRERLMVIRMIDRGIIPDRRARKTAGHNHEYTDMDLRVIALYVRIHGDGWLSLRLIDDLCRFVSENADGGFHREGSSWVTFETDPRPSIRLRLKKPMPLPDGVSGLNVVEPF